jgi:hypothetical protein
LKYHILTLSLILATILGAIMKEQKAPNLTELNNQEAALILADLTLNHLNDKKELRRYLELIDSRDEISQSDPSITVGDFSIKAVQVISGVTCNSEKVKLKAIISCSLGEEIFRFHIAQYSDEEKAAYKNKILALQP